VLERPALPAIRFGAAKRKTCQKGKFQGMTASTTPSGSQATKLWLASVGTSSGARKPAAWSAKKSQAAAHLSTSARPPARTLPISRAISSA